MLSLTQLLARYTPFDEHESAMAAQLREFLDDSAGEDAFGRDLAGRAPLLGHITGSAWVVNATATRVVMVHHAKLRKWVQPGGHCDGDSDVLRVAMREAREEIGLDVIIVQPEIFDIDVHSIPKYWNTPAHLHFDVRFLLRADDALAPIVSLESRAVKWVSLDEAAALNLGESIARMIAKTRRLAQ